MRIKYRVYRYAPEQSIFWVDGKIFADMYSDLAHDLGYMVICGKAKEAEIKLKRLVRAGYKEVPRCTIGFFDKENKSRYYYTRQLVCDSTKLGEKARIYKEWKRYCMENPEMNNKVDYKHVIKVYIA